MKFSFISLLLAEVVLLNVILCIVLHGAVIKFNSRLHFNSRVCPGDEVVMCLCFESRNICFCFKLAVFAKALT